MKKHRFDRIETHRHVHRPHFRKINRRGRKEEASFRELLKSYLEDLTDENEVYSVNLPQHGKYWDNGYEDVG